MPTHDRAPDLAAALGGLDRATRNFSRRLGEARALANVRSPHVEQTPTPMAAVGADRAAPPRPTECPSAEQGFEARLREAEGEAREYLDRAKERADSLVAAMIDAVEQDAEAIRRDAEEGMRNRWLQVESDAVLHLEEARRVGAAIVAERRQRLSALSDGIAHKAEALSACLDDADRVRLQFEAFLRALAVTAGRIAVDASASGSTAEIRDLRQHPRSSALAA